MKSTFSLISDLPLLPIIQPANIRQALKLAEAIAKGGIKSIEVVRRTPVAFEALRAIRDQFPELNVGMGTLLNSNHINQAMDSGAQFLITPTITKQLLSSLITSGAPFLPGVATPSDILMAYESGVREMKFFPAHLSGGPAFIKAIGSVFSDVNFCPTGGINNTNAQDYLCLPNVKAVGGTWMIPQSDVASGNWEAITQRCLHSTTIFEEVEV